jgi:hypothetical protein
MLCTPCLNDDGGIYGDDIPDSGIGDAGATVPGCFSCIQQTCPAQLMSCNGDCSCQQGADIFFRCLAAGTPPVTCGMNLGEYGSSASALAQCAAPPLFDGGGSGCLSQCGVTGVGIADAAATD